jgi:hypothetical protein
MPWPLTRQDLSAFAHADLLCERFENYFDEEDPSSQETLPRCQDS